ncbi:MAG TPA: N utilization substance protein B, partial [Rubrivivax sp.]|nr:N utilization substance protein B [Rubrivivax sp.]
MTPAGAPPPPPPANPTDKPAAGSPYKKRPAQRSPRRRSRELAMQGLYQWLIAGGEAAGIEADIQ